MASKALRRPNGLLQQNQESLRSQHLQQALSKSSGPSRPPQLPGIQGSAGYPPSLPRIGTPVAMVEREDGSLGASQSSSSSTAVARKPSTPTKHRQSSSSSRNGSSRNAPRQSRSMSLDSPSNRAPDRSPTTKLSPRSKEKSSRGASSSSDRADGLSASPPLTARDDDDEDAQLARDLDDLEDLRMILDPHPEDGRPASSSTTAAGESTIGYATTPSVGSSAQAEHGALPDDPLDSLQGAVRAHRDLQQIKLPFGCRIESSGCGAQFFFIMDVGDGPYTPATFSFWIKIFDEYPDAGSVSVRCSQRIFHPNVDPNNGRIEFLDDSIDEQPYRIRSLLTDIHQMIINPSASRVIKNSEAAKLLETNPDEFRRTVRLTLGGGPFGGCQFEKLLGKPTVKASTTARAAAPLADSTKVELMQLEVLKEQFKDQMALWQISNDAEAEGLST